MLLVGDARITFENTLPVSSSNSYSYLPQINQNMSHTKTCTQIFIANLLLIIITKYYQWVIEYKNLGASIQ